MKISIITATYNSSAHITGCLASVNGQTFQTTEHIIIDGASIGQRTEVRGQRSEDREQRANPTSDFCLPSSDFCLLRNSFQNPTTAFTMPSTKEMNCNS